jgi:succinate dehydrogenase / fumarate reductase flavoprotein subunit
MEKEIKLDSRIPGGTMRDKWTTYQSTVPLVSPNNKRRIDVIIVGSGLAGASAAASMGELGYNVKVFTFHDSPRRAHSNGVLQRFAQLGAPLPPAETPADG